MTVSRGQVWEPQSNLKAGHKKNTLATDRSVAALSNDWKRRGCETTPSTSGAARSPGFV
jgi:hypothetical protein